MRYALIRSLLLLLFVSGCDSSWHSRFPIGTKLYDNNGQHLFGQVVEYENRHDFQNGTEPGPSILIETADDSHERVWGSCATCAATFDVRTP